MKNHEGVYIKLHKINDADLIKRLHQVDNKQGYIKDLIKHDIDFIKVLKQKWKGVTNEKRYWNCPGWYETGR